MTSVRGKIPVLKTDENQSASGSKELESRGEASGMSRNLIDNRWLQAMICEGLRS